MALKHPHISRKFKKTLKKNTNVMMGGTEEFIQSIRQIVAEKLRSTIQSFNMKQGNMSKESL